MSAWGRYPAWNFSESFQQICKYLKIGPDLLYYSELSERVRLLKLTFNADFKPGGELQKFGPGTE